jgi:hypothetical protein
MAEEQKEVKPKKRMTATQAAALITQMNKEIFKDTLRAREEGKQKIAYTSIVCHHEEIFRAMDVIPGGRRILPVFAGQRGMRKDFFRERSLSAFLAPCAPTPSAGSVLINGEKNWAKCLRMLRGGDRQGLIS